MSEPPAGSAAAMGPTGAGSVQPTTAGTVSGAAGAAWWSGMRQQFTQVQQHLWERTQAASVQIQTASKSWKPPDLSKGLGMKVDVDFLNPAITGIRQQWQQLPEPVRDVLPYAGVALAAGVGVQRLYSEQLSQAQRRYGHLRDDYALLQAQFNQVEAQLAQLQERRGYYPLEEWRFAGAADGRGLGKINNRCSSCCRGCCSCSSSGRSLRCASARHDQQRQAGRVVARWRV